MNRVPLECNRLTAQRNRERESNYHKRRLKSIYSSPTGKRAAKQYNHVSSNLKGRQIKREKEEKIKRENKILVNKLSRVKRKKKKVVSSTNTLKRGNRFKKQSSNFKRRTEMKRIEEENRRLQKRIKERKGFYNHVDWERDRKKSEYLINNVISRYHYRNKSPKKRRKGSPGKRRRKKISPNSTILPVEKVKKVLHSESLEETKQRELSIEVEEEVENDKNEQTSIGNNVEKTEIEDLESHEPKIFIPVTPNENEKNEEKETTEPSESTNEDILVESTKNDIVKET